MCLCLLFVVPRIPAAITVGVVTFLLGLPSAMHLDILVNQVKCQQTQKADRQTDRQTNIYRQRADTKTNRRTD